MPFRTQPNPSRSPRSDRAHDQRQRRVLGVDIGSTAIKVAQLRRGEGGYGLTKLGICETPSRQPGQSGADHAAMVARALRGLLGEIGATRLRCAVAVQGDEVAARLFEIPMQALIGDRLADALAREGRETLPFAVEASALDHLLFPAGRSRGAAAGMMVAARPAAVDRACSIARQAGLEPVIVDLAGLAIANTFLEADEGALPEATTMLIHFGASVTNLAVIAPDGRVFVRDVSASGHALTAAVRDTFELSEIAARELVRGPRLDQSLPPETLTQIASEQLPLLRAGLSDLIEDVRATIQHLQVSRWVSSVDDVWLAGGAARFPGVPMYLADQLGIPVRGWNPLLDVDASHAQPAVEAATIGAAGPTFAVALGLAMRRDPG